MPNIELAASLDPSSLLDGPVPRLLDEWQQVPQIWNPMRRACDDRAAMGQFLLTGSANPPDDITRHSSAGRVARMRMRPMSLFESGESDGIESLRTLKDRVNTKRMGEPIKLAVITATGSGFELPDNIAVIPITALGP